MTTSRSRGMSTSTFLRLCSRAPRMTMLPASARRHSRRAPAARRGDGAASTVARYSASCAGVSASKRIDQHRLRVRRAQQAPAVREPHAHAVDVDRCSRPSARKRSRTRSATSNFTSSGQSTRISGVVSTGRQVGEQLGDGLAGAAEDLEQPRAGVDRVVEAEVALREEDVAAHLAAEQRARLPHLGLDQRVAGLPHDAAARRAARCRRTALRALHLGHDRPRPGCARSTSRANSTSSSSPQMMRPVAVDDADAVGVAVERDAELGPGLPHRARSAPACSPRPSDRDGGSGSARPARRRARVTSRRGVR